MTSVKDELLEGKAENKIRNLEEPPLLRIREGEARRQKIMREKKVQKKSNKRNRKSPESITS